MRNFEEIKKIINEHKPIVQERFKIKSVGIFGSYVRKSQNEKGNIDVLVDFVKLLICLILLNWKIF
jgi:predicted nucleotidyltransferase